MVFDLLILDVNFNGITSLDYIEKIRIEKKDFKIIALTTLNNNYIKTKATLKGVDIFIGKDSNLSIFPKIIKDCVENNKNDSFKLSSKIEIENIFFTSRKIEVLQKLYQYSNKTEKEIAGILCISVSALKTHKQEMFSLTNTKNTLELIKFGIEKGLILI